MEKANSDETHPVAIGDETQPTQADTDTRPTIIEGETIASKASSSTEEAAPGDAASIEDEPKQARHISRWYWISPVIILALVLVAGVSAYEGYQSGIDRRVSHEATLVADEAQQQFQLGLQDIEDKRYEVARQRFEYVIRIEPNYPGVTEQLAMVLLELNTTATPTPVPTPTLTPTPDMRGAEELYLQARTYLAERQWTEAIETLLKLRKDEPDYQMVKVDSMLYTALRNRGVQRILNEADLEGGTYDLARAEAFGPIDVEANNYRTWADYYVTGASFWKLNWGQAAHFFRQLLLVAPNLRDSSNITATERFRVATLNYADELAANGEMCAAQELYQAVLNLGPNPGIEPTAAWVGNQCETGRPGEEEPGEPPPPEATPSPEPEITPTPEPTPDPYPAP